jgi:hypothetical protein
MSKVEFIIHKNIRILLLDVSRSASVEENIAGFTEAEKLILKEPAKSVRLLTDVTQAHYTQQAVDAMKDFSKTITPHIKASAAVGVGGIKKIVLQSLVRLSGRDIKMFDDREQALDWLCQQQ